MITYENQRKTVVSKPAVSNGVLSHYNGFAIVIPQSVKPVFTMQGKSNSLAEHLAAKANLFNGFYSKSDKRV